MNITEAQRKLLTGSRAEAWRYDLLDLNDRKIGQLEEVTSGSFEFSIFTTIRSSGQIQCRAEGINWLKVRIQPWYTVSANGETMKWPVGIFIPASPGTQYSGDGSSQAIELYDKLQILVDDKVENTYSVPAGTNVTDHIKGIIATTGETKDAITPSDSTLRNSMVWEADATKLQIINDLLASINYFSLWVDGYGVFHGTPYLAPGDRGLAWNFRDGSRSVYSPDFFNDLDEFNVPNKIVLVSASDGETPALTAVASNENPASKYSYNNRGRWITKTELDVEAADQLTLSSLAQRKLAEANNVASTYEISHALLPIQLNDAVEFTRSTENINITAVVQKMSFSTDVGAQVRTTIKEVAL